MTLVWETRILCLIKLPCNCHTISVTLCWRVCVHVYVWMRNLNTRADFYLSSPHQSRPCTWRSKTSGHCCFRKGLKSICKCYMNFAVFTFTADWAVICQSVKRELQSVCEVSWWLLVLGNKQLSSICRSACIWRRPSYSHTFLQRVPQQCFSTICAYACSMSD